MRVSHLNYQGYFSVKNGVRGPTYCSPVSGLGHGMVLLTEFAFQCPKGTANPLQKQASCVPCAGLPSGHGLSDLLIQPDVSTTCKASLNAA